MKLDLSRLTFRRVLLYYAAIFSVFMFIGGWYSMNDAKEFLANILLFPVFLYLWISLWSDRKSSKMTKNNFAENQKTTKGGDYFKQFHQ